MQRLKGYKSRLLNVCIGLILVVTLSGCASFRPWGYTPPIDSNEYIMQRDNGPEGTTPATTGAPIFWRVSSNAWFTEGAMAPG